MEHAQRKAFLDTRNCIAARLEMEDENEKLVSDTECENFQLSLNVCLLKVLVFFFIPEGNSEDN
jgi:hypothetical protein